MNPVIRACVRFVYHIAYDLHFEGLENIPADEGVVIASNHRSYADPVLLTVHMKRPVKYMAKEELFKNKLFAAFIRMLGAFPVKRGKGDMKVIDDSVELLKNKNNLVIFPEGTRSKENKVGKGKTGVAMIAARSGADVLPVGICFEGKKLKFRCRLTVKYGKLIKYDELGVTDGSPKELKAVKLRIMDDITTLVEGQPHERNSAKPLKESVSDES